jgi:hypothetical protein
MTQEEKAKAYDKAIERAKSLIRDTIIEESGQHIAEVIFPELKESEDERIRKAIHIYLDWLDGHKDYQPKGNYTIKDMIAWLEKQDDQKPADKVEPKFKVKYAGSEYNVFETKDIAGATYYGIEDEPNHIDYVQAENCEIIDGYGIKKNGCSFPTKPIMFSEQSPAWSEEDEKMCQETIDWFEKKCFPYALESENPARESINWLKALKQRIGG